MNSKQGTGDAHAWRTRIEKSAIAIIAMIAVAVAIQFQLQPGAIANSPAVSPALVLAGGPQEMTPIASIAKLPLRYNLSKSPAYCPLGSGDAEGGSRKSICSRIWSLDFSPGAIGDAGLLSWVRGIAGTGASKFVPAIEFLAGNCLAFLK